MDPVIRFLDLFVVTSSIAKYQFKAEMRRRMGFYKTSFLNAACCKKIFQLDSNFPYGNSGSSFGILNLFHFLNQEGEVSLYESLIMMRIIRPNSCDFCRVRFYLFILDHFVEHRDQMFWGLCRCSKPEN